MDKTKEVDESKFKADFLIMDNYIKFSGELLRLSLLAIGGFGTLILLRIKDQDKIEIFSDPLFPILSLAFFVLASAAALFHRYFATDSMSWYISLLRAENRNDVLKTEKERKGLHKILGSSRISLVVCEIAFGLGVILFFVSILEFFN